MVTVRLSCYLAIFILFYSGAGAQVRLCSWNIQDFGNSKSDSEIVYIAKKLRDFDVLAIMEVVAGPGGAQAVGRLAEELNRTGAKWDYAISNPTSGNGYRSERYAYLWKTAKIKKRKSTLEKEFHQEIEREPYLIEFEYKQKGFTVCLLHAITRERQPEREIKYLKYIESRYPMRNIIFCGDFNCVQTHSVFNPLKARGYIPTLLNCKTTLKQKLKGTECLASAYDNIFYNNGAFNVISSGAIPFYKDFEELTQARKISDHLPIYCEFTIR